MSDAKQIVTMTAAEAHQAIALLRGWRSLSPDALDPEKRDDRVYKAFWDERTKVVREMIDLAERMVEAHIAYKAAGGAQLMDPQLGHEQDFFAMMRFASMFGAMALLFGIPKEASEQGRMMAIGSLLNFVGGSVGEVLASFASHEGAPLQ